MGWASAVLWKQGRAASGPEGDLEVETLVHGSDAGGEGRTIKGDC